MPAAPECPGVGRIPMIAENPAGVARFDTEGAPRAALAGHKEL
jgi:hypothetical protein